MRDRFAGCLLGLSLADALGAKHEGGVIGGMLWSVLSLRRPGVLQWTDDTLMATGTAESLLACGELDEDDLARRWAEDCTWARGYGAGALAMLRRVAQGEDWRAARHAVFPDGSFGNGAAMRAAPLALFFGEDPQRMEEATRRASAITHAHPLGIEGGVLIAHATQQALHGTVDVADLSARCEHDEFRSRLERVPGLLEQDPGKREVVRALGNKIVAHESAVTAVYAYLRCREQSFEDLVAYVVSLGGDTDTIGAMAGGIWGAEHGEAALPAALLARLEDRERIRDLGHRLHDTRPAS